MASPDRIIAAVNAAQAQTENPDSILRATVDALTELRPAFWVACLTTTDPSATKLTRQTDRYPIFVDYIELAQCGGGESQAPVSARVIESGEPLFMPSIDARDFIRQYADALLSEADSRRLPEEVSLLVVPMRVGGAILGTLGIYATAPAHGLTEEDIVWIQLVADNTALAIEHGRLAKEARDRFDRFAALDGIVQAITSSHEMSVVFNIVVDRIRAVVGIDACELLRVDASDNSLAAVARAGFRSTAMGGVGLNLGNPLLNQAFDSRRIEDLRSAGAIDDAQRRSMFAREGFVAYAAWPLVSQGRVLGALQIFHRSELTLDAEASGFVTCLAAMSAVAIQIATLEQEWHDRPCAGERGAAVDFSPVEWRVLQLVVEGWTNEEIGAQVHLSASTIKSHVRRILDKSGATNRTNLARRATREGWV